jgi:hypothetical protein
MKRWHAAAALLLAPWILMSSGHAQSKRKPEQLLVQFGNKQSPTAAGYTKVLPGDLWKARPTMIAGWKIKPPTDNRKGQDLLTEFFHVFTRPNRLSVATQKLGPTVEGIDIALLVSGVTGPLTFPRESYLVITTEGSSPSHSARRATTKGGPQLLQRVQLNGMLASANALQPRWVEARVKADPPPII